MAQEYNTRECDRCDGTGRRHDATMADKVCAVGDTSVQCSACRGTGVLSTLRPDPSHVIAAAALALAAQPDWTPDTEALEWMS